MVMNRKCLIAVTQGKKIVIVLDKDLGIFESLDKDVGAIRKSASDMFAYYLTHDFAEPWKICHDKDDMTVGYVVTNAPIVFTKNKDTYGLTPMNFKTFAGSASRNIMERSLYVKDDDE